MNNDKKQTSIDKGLISMSVWFDADEVCIRTEPVLLLKFIHSTFI